jgi:hypothetical protein
MEDFDSITLEWLFDEGGNSEGIESNVGTLEGKLEGMKRASSLGATRLLHFS